METKTIARFYDNKVEAWDANYTGNADDIGQYEILRRRELVLEILFDRLHNHETLLLDVGCGTGRVISELIVRRPTWQAIGLDLSGEMIDFCQRTYYEQPNLKFFQYDISQAPLPLGAADAALALGVWGYLPDPELAIEHLYDSLQPNGLLIFSINKPSLPRALTVGYRAVRELFKDEHRHRATRNKSYRLADVLESLSGRFTLLETRDYCYLPYLPGIRRFLRFSKFMERRLGKRPTPFSSATLIVAQKLPAV